MHQHFQTGVSIVRNMLYSEEIVPIMSVNLSNLQSQALYLKHINVVNLPPVNVKKILWFTFDFTEVLCIILNMHNI